MFGRAYNALVPGGFMMFDMAGWDRVPQGAPQRSFAGGEDCAVLVSTVVDRENHILTCDITAFRQVGSLYRRSKECHRLILAEPKVVLASLQGAGFIAQTCSTLTMTNR